MLTGPLLKYFETIGYIMKEISQILVVGTLYKKVFWEDRVEGEGQKLGMNMHLESLAQTQYKYLFRLGLECQKLIG